MHRPRLLIGTEDAVNRDVDWAEPNVLAQVEAEPAHWQEIHDAMLGVTQDPRGSGRTSMLGTAYAVAGKTGTAQVFTIAQEAKYKADEVDERLRDHGLFVAFAPATAPRIAVAVVIENGGGGSTAAAPVARKIMDAYFAAEGTLPQNRAQPPVADRNERDGAESTQSREVYVARQH
jgi:penicillin-binding protein 2